MSSELDKDTVNMFLLELTALTAKHGIRVGGCSCCGSPWLGPAKKPGNYRYVVDARDDNLAYVEVEDMLHD